MENPTDGTHNYFTNEVYGDAKEIKNNIMRYINRQDRVTFALIKNNVFVFYIWTDKEESEMAMVGAKLRGILEIDFKMNTTTV